MKTSRYPLVILGILLFAGFFASCTENGPRHLLEQKSLDAILSGYAETESYGIYMMNHKVGWLDGTWSVSPDGIHCRQEIFMEITSMNQTTRLSQKEDRVFEAKSPWRLLFSTWEIHQDGDTSQGTVTYTDGTWTRIENGKPAGTMDLSGYSIADDLGVEILMASGAKQGASLKLSSFSPSESVLSAATVTIKTLGVEKVGGVDTTVAVLNYLQKETQLEMVTDARGHTVKGNMGPFLEFRREDSLTARNLDAAFDLFEQTVIRVDVPLGTDSRTLKAVKMSFSGLDPAALQSFPGQTVTREGTSVVVSLEIPRPVRPKLNDQEVKDALERDSRFPADDPRMKELAGQALMEARTDREKLAALLLFTSMYIEDALVPDSLSMDDLLKRRKGDCSEHSRLFVALARSAGIPAREISGFYYMGDTLKAWGAHAWAEVLLDGAWTMVDPVMNQPVIDVRHIATGTGVNDFANAMGYFRGITGKVLEVR